MKNIYTTAVLLLTSFALSFANLLEVAEETACDSINNELNSKFRFLGDWDSNGTPNYMDPGSDEVSQALIDFVNETLPESTDFANSNDSYFGLDVQLNTELTEASEVYLTMVHEGAGWTNTLGFYTYELDSPPATVYDIDSLVVLFPNVSQTNVIKPGDKIFLGEFPENTVIGYFLIAKGWVGDTICLKSHLIFTNTHLNTFTSEEYQQQTILLSNEQENKFLLGFEDIIRPGGDNDFNDAVFYITASPGAIDTTNVVKIPTAYLSGDTTLCDENDPAIITVELSGHAPWTLVYTNSAEEIELVDIEDSVYVFETLIGDTITLVSVKDKNSFGIVDGKAIINISQPSATLKEDQPICGGVDGFMIEFEGKEPYSLTYKFGDDEKTIDNILENQFELIAKPGDVVELLAMSDQFCDGEISQGSALVRSIEFPGLTLEGNSALCGDDARALLDLKLTGQGPWNVNYLFEEEEYNLEITSGDYQLEISVVGELTFNSIEDANCVSALQTSYIIESRELPTAAIKDFVNDCGESSASIEVAFTGTGPWMLGYSMDGEVMTAESSEHILELSIDQSGLFELIHVEDAYCENIAEGSLEIEFNDSPTATIGEDVSICTNDEATISVSLTGSAPFTFVYSDGETETTVSTEENLYEFVTSEFKTYTLVSIVDVNCSGVIDGSATVSDASEDLQVEIDADATSCFGEDINLSLIGEIDELTIVWTTEGNGILENTDQLETSYAPSENETGVIVFYAEVNNGCSVKTISKEVTIIEEIDASFRFSPDSDLLTNSQITYTPSQNNYDEYNWDFGDDNTSSATISSNEYVLGGKYTVNLHVELSGCEGSGSAELEVLSKDELYVPNAFNPGAQNPENQVVKVYGNNIDEYGFGFKIVNRWGKVMYQTNSFYEANSNGWNGINNNNSEAQELNVFSYILNGRFTRGETFERTGTITQVK